MIRAWKKARLPLPQPCLQTLGVLQSTKACTRLSKGEFFLQNLQSALEAWPLCPCVLREEKLLWDSDHFWRPQAPTACLVAGASYPSARVAHTEKASAQPLLCKGKPFPEPISNTASTFDHSWSFLLSETRHTSPGWLAGWCNVS